MPNPKAVDPRLGISLYQETYNPPYTDVPGGGGCPGVNEVLVPDLPFDFLQPPMKRQVVQVGYGGPFVIRSNPIGALLDLVRGFCSPVPMQQTAADGSAYSDLSGNGLGTYGDYTGTYPGDYGTGSLGYGFQAPTAGANCVQCSNASVYDPVQMCCVPTPTGAGTNTTPSGSTAAVPMSCDDTNYLNMIGNDSANAWSNQDCNRLCTDLGIALNCSKTASLPGLTGTGGKWYLLWGTIKGYLATMGITNCVAQCDPATGKKVGTKPAANTGNQSSPPMGSGTTPPASGTTAPSPTSSTANPPMTTPAANPNPVPAAFQTYPMAVVQSFRPMRMPNLPQMPNPASLTEGNINLMPSTEPMLGSFDPARVNPSVQPRSFRARVLGAIRRAR